MDQLGLEECLSQCLLSDEEYSCGQMGWDSMEVRNV